MQNGIYPMDPDVLMIWEKQLKKREKELKTKEAQMGFFLHNMSYHISRLYATINYYNCLNDKDSDRKIVYEKDIERQVNHLRIVFKTYQFYINPVFFEHELFGPKDVHSLISKICSYYSNEKKIAIHIKDNLTKENKPRLGSSFELAVAMIVDNAIVNAPNNSDFTISFYEAEERLTVEFKSWERCKDSFKVTEGKVTYYLEKRAFGSGIIRNTEDENVALTLFKQMCDYNNIDYCFSKGDETTIIDNENCQSYVVKLTFNSKEQ